MGPCPLTLAPVRCRCHCRCRSHCVAGEVVVLVLVVWFCVCEYVCVVFVVCCVRESESGCLCWLYLCRVCVWFFQVLLLKLCSVLMHVSVV